VAHALNPGYSGSRDKEDLRFRPAQAKSSRDPISTSKKPDMVEHTCHHQWLTPIILTTWEAEIRSILVQSQSRQKKARSYLKNK
jgi:hypothetical protein